MRFLKEKIQIEKSVEGQFNGISRERKVYKDVEKSYLEKRRIKVQYIRR